MNLTKILPIAALILSIAAPAKAEQLPYQKIQEGTKILTVALLKNLGYSSLAEEFPTSFVAKAIDSDWIDRVAETTPDLCGRLSEAEAVRGKRIDGQKFAEDLRSETLADIRKIPLEIQDNRKALRTRVLIVASINAQSWVLAMAQCPDRFEFPAAK